MQGSAPLGSGAAPDKKRAGMKQFLRVSSAILALALGLSAVPALAQDSTAPANASESVVGPSELSGFTLNGTVTRRPDPAPEAAARTQPPARQTASPAPQPSAATTARPEPAAPRGAAETVAEAAPRSAQATPAATGQSLSFDLPPPTPSQRPTAGFAADPFAAQPASVPPTESYAAQPGSGEDWGSRLPWLVALLAAAVAAAFYFRRQRSSYALAGVGANASAFDLAPERAAQPQPAPPPAPPAAAPRRPAAPAGVVTTRLRPWLEIEFAPTSATIDGERIIVEFEVAVFNSGSAPARDVLIEAMMFNAGPEQDQAIGAFFKKPVAQGERVPAIAPLQRMAFQSAVTFTREQMRLFAAGGRTVFVPLIGFNALYRWSSGEGQTSASYIVGRGTAGEKMAPFSVDKPRAFRDVAAREHSVRVRK